MKEVKETFAKLVAARLIERCPAPEPSLLPKDPEPPKKVARGAAVSDTIAYFKAPRFSKVLTTQDAFCSIAT